MKGQKTGGRVKGVPNKVKKDVKADIQTMCRAMIGDPLYQASFRMRWQEGKLPPAVECMVWHYAYGKPTETHQHTGADGGPIQTTVVFEDAPRA